MNTKSLFRSPVYILWGVAWVWGVVYADNLVYEAISTQNPNVPWYVNDIFSDVGFSLPSGEERNDVL